MVLAFSNLLVFSFCGTRCAKNNVCFLRQIIIKLALFIWCPYLPNGSFKLLEAKPCENHRVRSFPLNLHLMQFSGSDKAHYLKKSAFFLLVFLCYVLSPTLRCILEKFPFLLTSFCKDHLMDTSNFYYTLKRCLAMKGGVRYSEKLGRERKFSRLHRLSEFFSTQKGWKVLRLFLLCRSRLLERAWALSEATCRLWLQSLCRKITLLGAEQKKEVTRKKFFFVSAFLGVPGVFQRTRQCSLPWFG